MSTKDTMKSSFLVVRWPLKAKNTFSHVDMLVLVFLLPGLTKMSCSTHSNERYSCVFLLYISSI